MVKTNTSSPSAIRDVLLYGLAYVLWLLTFLACVVAVLEGRSAINVLWLALGHSRWTLGLADQLCLLGGGLATCVYVIFLESYYRQSVTHRAQMSQAGPDVSTQASRRGRLLQWLNKLGVALLLWRFSITIAIPLGLLIASLVAYEIAWRIIR